MSGEVNNLSQVEDEYVDLHKANQPWQPSFKVQNCPELGASSLLVEEKIKRNVLSRLNKLTPEKFNILLEQLKNLELDSLSKLEILVDLIYQKAINEPLYCSIYAYMCKHLALIKVPGENKTINFRKILLSKCQREFEYENRNKEAMDPTESDNFSNYDEEKKHKNKVLGNLRLIGELFQLHMLIEPIVHEVIKRLLTKNTDESLEGVCVLLKIIGKDLDESKKSKPKKSSVAKRNKKFRMDSYFESIQEIMKKPDLCSRIRFMLLDLIDLRQNNWVPRRVEIKPKTLEEIHQEVEQELQILEIC